MIEPMEALRRELWQALQRAELDGLRQQLATDPVSVRKALAVQMRLSGAFKTRRRRPDADTLREHREANRDALRLHNAKSGNILRERFEDACQNAIVWLCDRLANPQPADTAAGIIGIAARRCLEPMHTRETRDDGSDNASLVQSLFAALSGKPPLRDWDWIDYAAAREALSVRFRMEIIRGERTCTVATVAEQVESWLSDLPPLPVNAKPTPVVDRRHVRSVWLASEPFGQPNRPQSHPTIITRRIARQWGLQVWFSDVVRRERTAVDCQTAVQSEVPPQRYWWTLFMDENCCAILNDFAFGHGI